MVSGGRVSQQFMILVVIGWFVMLAGNQHVWAADANSVATKSMAKAADGGAPSSESGSTALPDLFSGTMSYQIPIEVPPGRNGMDPGISLKYRSGSGNGWLGVGWDLEFGSIQRSIKNGVNYGGDNFQFKTGSSVSDLVNVGNGEYLATVEGQFSRIKKVDSAEGPYWEVTNKSGVKFIYGRMADSRQDYTEPGQPTKTFKWCLNRIEDLNGNFTTITYAKDQGEIYPDQIDYNGNQIKFYREDRSDAPDMYTTNFLVKTLKRLKTIDIFANGTRIRKYELVYDVDPVATGDQYGPKTWRSLLSSVTQHNNIGEALPPIKLAYSSNGNFINYDLSLSNAMDSLVDGHERVISGDFNGDGRTDVAVTRTGWNGWRVSLSTDNGSLNQEWQIGNSMDSLADGHESVITGDFNGDGKTDIAVTRTGWNVWRVSLSTGSGFVNQVWPLDNAMDSLADGHERVITGDFNGDGKTDIAVTRTGWNGWRVFLSTGSGFVTQFWQLGNAMDSLVDGHESIITGDFNGDGKTDIAVTRTGWNGWRVSLSTGSAFDNKVWLLENVMDNLADRHERVITGDFNGDGKTDIAVTRTGWNGWRVSLSTGDKFVNRVWLLGNGNVMDSLADGHESVIAGDFNGDGRTDVAVTRTGWNVWRVFLSTGNEFVNQVWPLNIAMDNLADGHERVIAGDFNGDGRTDFAVTRTGWNVWRVAGNTILVSQIPDMLTSISNGLGGTTTIDYVPSTHYTNTQLPFPFQTVSSITSNDGNGNMSTTGYTYLGGYFHIGERDFRGFSHTTVTGQAGTDGVQTLSETWFHQGNDTAIDVNNPFVPTGYMKGKPYRTKVTDTAGTKYSETTTSYSPDNSSPYFNPPIQVDNYVYDGDSTPKHTQTVYAYNEHGNVVREEYHGETAADDRTTVRTFSPNIGNWIVGLPKSEDVYQGIGTTTKIAGKGYYYDDLSDCNGSPTGNQTPVYGKLTRAVSYLEGGTSPEIRIAYNTFGNPVCKRDAKGNTTTIAYDPSNTFPLTITNPLGQQSITAYYGVNGVAADKGLYGQVKSSSDPNGATTTIEYDTFGRKKLETYPDGTWSSMAYNNFGTVGSQYVRTANSAGLWKENYFDGFSRTFKVRSSGPDNKTISSLTTYNSTGTVQKASLPYFEGLETPRYQTYTYDTTGRVLTATNTDATVSKSCYKGGVTVKIDANNHRRREVRNVLGRLVTVQEYTGNNNDTCTTDIDAPYSTTTYQYDIPGNLRFLTDTKGNQTEMRYDTLGRKRYMNDPDMGSWNYTYDANGNLETQTDAKGQLITFTYDALNRLKTKIYGSTTITNYYDEVATGYYNKGHLTKITDDSGQTTYKYDSMGRVADSVKIINGYGAFQTSFGYTNGRLNSVTYPDSETVTYGYNGGLLSSVGGYAGYSGFNALGQPETVTFGNGVATTYGYRSDNSRLRTIATNKGGAQLLSLLYSYDNVGNIGGIANLLDSSRSQSFMYDELNRLTQFTSISGTSSYSYDEIGNIRTKEGVIYGYGTKPHAVTTRNNVLTYSYDANGNLFSDALRGASYTYNYDNMPSSIGNTSFTYDGTGTRVIKSSPAGTTAYVSKLYECKNSTCSKYIFAGDTRIAHKSSGVVNYFHPDHLGSTNLVTNATGTVVEDIAYYPFGSSRLDSNTLLENHKYTGQEKDSETGLYNYNARLYDAELGRFISADPFISNPSNPQSLNRYSYVQNNPLNYTDPYGYWRVSLSLHIGVGFDLSYDSDNGHLRGGAGVGMGGGISVGDGKWDVGASTGCYLDVGFDNKLGPYATTNYGQSITAPGMTFGAGGSATVYPRSGNYHIGVGAGMGIVGINAGYSNRGPSLGGSLGGVGATYNFGSKSWNYSVSADIDDLKKTYQDAVASRAYNGYGAEGGNRIFNSIIDTLGTISCGYEASDNHDYGYGAYGETKSRADFGLFKNMVVGAASNTFNSNGFIKLGVGLTISPLYYTAVTVGGREAYEAAQSKYWR